MRVNDPDPGYLRRSIRSVLSQDHVMLQMNDQIFLKHFSISCVYGEASIHESASTQQFISRGFVYDI